MPAGRNGEAARAAGERVELSGRRQHLRVLQDERARALAVQRARRSGALPGVDVGGRHQACALHGALPLGDYRRCAPRAAGVSARVGRVVLRQGAEPVVEAEAVGDRGSIVTRVRPAAPQCQSVNVDWHFCIRGILFFVERPSGR